MRLQRASPMSQKWWSVAKNAVDFEEARRRLNMFGHPHALGKLQGQPTAEMEVRPLRDHHLNLRSVSYGLACSKPITEREDGTSYPWPWNHSN